LFGLSRAFVLLFGVRALSSARGLRFEGTTFAIEEPKHETGKDTLPVCLGFENPCRLEGQRRIWSLLDLTRYAVRDLHTLLLWIDHMANYTRGQEPYRYGESAVLNKGETDSILQQMTCVRKHFVELELTDAIPALDDLTSRIHGMNLGECRVIF
jgi:hypothetical protein